jgi:hypothetical protein
MKQELIVGIEWIDGIVLFDHPGILNFFGGKIELGQNILDDFVKTNKGDEVLDQGVALPIIGVGCEARVRLFVDENPTDDREVVYCDKYFYLNVTGKLYIGDMLGFWEWHWYLGEYGGWIETIVPKGIYKVCVEGVHLLDADGKRVVDKDGWEMNCYDLTFISVDKLGKRDVEPRGDSKVNAD